MTNIGRHISLAAAVLALWVIPSAQADTIATFSLTLDGCAGTCASGPFGTITLADNLAGMVTVTETLKAGERFAGTGAGQAIEFQLVNPSAPGLVINVQTADFSSAGAATASSFGSFNQSIVCNTCQGGNAGNPAGPLVFTVTDTAKDISFASFIANAGGFFFAADVVGTNGNTGNVASTGPTGVSGGQTPEPASVWLTLGGVAMVAVRKFRRNNRA